MEGTYFDDWEYYCDVAASYGDNTPEPEEIVYAGYTYESYEGSAIVVYVRDGLWFENNDYHCSCSGLEHWEPELTMPEALLMRTGWTGLREAVEARLRAMTVDYNPRRRSLALGGMTLTREGD